MKAEDFWQPKENKYFKGSELAKDIELTISKVEEHDFAFDSRCKPNKKPVVHFKETDKRLVVNKIIWKEIEHITTQKDATNWRGYKITLTTRQMEINGKMVLGIRVIGKSYAELEPHKSELEFNPDLMDRL